MSTQFTNRQWRLPNNENKDKQSNYSMDFDGSSSVINLGNTDAVKLGAGDFTFSAWINPDSWGSGYEGIYSNNATNGVYIGKDNAGNFVLRIVNVSNVISHSTLPTANTWTHICITRLNGTCTLYYNGSSVATASSTQNFNANTNVYIGGDPGTGPSTSALMNGKIDAVSIFNYALTDGTGGTVNQIATLYGSSSTGIGNPMSLSPKPVAYYPLGDQDAFNGADYLVPNSSLKDYVFGFNGSNGYVDYGYTALTAISGGSSTLTTSMTISIWFKLNNATSEKGLIYFGDLNNNYGGFTIRHYASKFNFLRGSSHIITGGYSFTDTTSWHNMTLVYDPTNASNCYLYIDGSDTGVTFNASVGNIDFLNSNLSQRSLIIGTYYNTSYIFNGEMSNAQIFNSALPATGSNSVETLYNNGSPLTSMSGFTSLVGWWKLDASATYDSSTNTWTIPDDSTNSNTGTSSGMTQANLVQSDLSFTSGYSPYALEFDGASSDAITLGNTIGNGFTQITCSAWVNLSTTELANNSIYRNFLVKFNGTALGPFELRGNYARGDSGNNKLFFRVATDTGSYGFTDTGFAFTEANRWYHIVGTYDGSNVKTFVDGVEKSSISANGTLVSNSDNATIGFDTSTGGFDGKISNPSIWNAALTSAQVTELYSGGVPQNLLNHSAVSSLVSWWQLGSNSSFNSSLNQWTCIDEKGTNTGESSQTFNEDAIVDGVGSYANGLSSGMGGDEVIGDAPYSTANALSVNMDVEDRVTDTPS